MALSAPGAELSPAAEEGAWYHSDLIGLAAVNAANEPLGRVIAIHNFGAGDIIEIAPLKGAQTMLLPFTNAVVPTVDLAGGRVVIELPQEIDGEDCWRGPRLDRLLAGTAGSTVPSVEAGRRCGVGRFGATASGTL